MKTENSKDNIKKRCLSAIKTIAPMTELDGLSFVRWDKN